jgi:hypothetical protein
MNYNQHVEIDFSAQISVAAKEKKTLNKPFRTPNGPKKFSVYVKNDKGNIVKVNFGDPNMEIKRDDPNRRKSFRARHHCDTNPGPKWKARYWSCKTWQSGKSVTEVLKASVDLFQQEWDGETFWDQDELLKINPELAQADDIEVEKDPEEMLFNAQESAEMAVTIFDAGAEKLKEMIDLIKNDPAAAARCSDPWMLADIALIENYINNVHGYIVYPREGYASEVIENSEDDFEEGCAVMNINSKCAHYGSQGIVKEVKDLPDNMGKVVSYEVTNDGANYKKGDILAKTKDQLRKFDPKKFIPSTLTPSVLKQLQKISDEIRPPEKEHGEKEGGISEDVNEYRSKYEKTKW